MTDKDTAIATRFVCAKDAEEALQFARTSWGQGVCDTMDEARSFRCAQEDDFELIVIARRIKP